MAISLKHLFASPKTDGLDPTLVQPSNWNAEHVLTQASDRLIGRYSAGTGASQEIALGTPFTVAGGTLAFASTVPVGTLQATNLSVSGSVTGAISFTGAATFSTSPSFEVGIDVKAPATGNAAARFAPDGGGTTWNVVAEATGKFRISDVVNARFPFWIEQNAPNNTLYMDSDGDVGFGTNSPETPIHVSRTTGAMATLLLLQNNNNCQIQLRNSTTSRNWTLEHRGNDFQIASDEVAGPELTLSGQGRLTLASGITLNGSFIYGDSANPGISSSETGVGIGPGGLISVGRSGDIAAVFNRNASDGTLVQWRREGTVRGSVSITTTATAYNTTSDYRLKEDLRPIADPIERLMTLIPRNFGWIGTNKRSDGFLSHEVQPIVPDAVTGEKDAVDDEGNPIFQQLDHSKLVPLLTASLQKLHLRVAELEALLADQMRQT